MSSSTSASTSTNHELDAPPWRRMESTLMSTANAIRACYDDRLAPLGLTLSTAMLLAYVNEFGPVNQTRAAEHLDQGRAATGAQVDRLEALGLVERRTHTDDRRVWMLAVTPEGAAMAARIAECDAVLRAELRDGISRSERQQLARLLVRLQHNLLAAQRYEHPTHTP
ncbi:MAG TPA: MarR family transcriptional regulator [Ilumatobacter sp.]|nr:MarR family transcriptional regulator [Ilumatobacter sp.]